MGAFANRCVIALAAADNSTANSTTTATATSSSASSTATGSSSGAVQRATLSGGLAACVVMVLAGMVMLG
jgi:hypothetical protein